MYFKRLWMDLYLDIRRYTNKLIIITRRVPVQRAVERDEIPYPWKSTTRRCVPY